MVQQGASQPGAYPGLAPPIPYAGTGPTTVPGNSKQGTNIVLLIMGWGCAVGLLLVLLVIIGLTMLGARIRQQQRDQMAGSAAAQMR